MYSEEDRGSGQHGMHQGEPRDEKREGNSEDCGCGGRGHHGMHGAWHDHGYRCGCRHHEGVGFHRHFIPREEIIARLE